MRDSGVIILLLRHAARLNIHTRVKLTRVNRHERINKVR